MMRNLPKDVLFGYIAPIIALVGIELAILISPNFHWETNALSDLGHYTRTDIGPNPLVRAIIFNVGLIITGVLLIIMILGFMKQLNDRPTRIAMITFLIALGFLRLNWLVSYDYLQS